MGGENDGAAAQAQVAGEPQAQGDQAQAAVTAGLQGANVADNGGDAVARAHKDYEAALAERDARIAELEGEIAEAAKTAEGAEALRRETTTTTSRSSRPPSLGCSARVRLRPRRLARRGCPTRAPRLTRARR